MPSGELAFMLVISKSYHTSILWDFQGPPQNSKESGRSVIFQMCWVFFFCCESCWLVILFGGAQLSSESVPLLESESLFALFTLIFYFFLFLKSIFNIVTPILVACNIAHPLASWLIYASTAKLKVRQIVEKTQKLQPRNCEYFKYMNACLQPPYDFHLDEWPQRAK